MENHTWPGWTTKTAPPFPPFVLFAQQAKIHRLFLPYHIHKQDKRGWKGVPTLAIFAAFSTAGQSNNPLLFLCCPSKGNERQIERIDKQFCPCQSNRGPSILGDREIERCQLGEDAIEVMGVIKDNNIVSK